MHGRNGAGAGLLLGEGIRLLPMMGGRLLHGTVLAATPVPDPDGAGTLVRVLPQLSGSMDGIRVWVIAGLPEQSAVTVHQGRLVLTPHPGEARLVDLALLADEPRRAALRAAARRPVLLLQPGKVSSGTTSIDLSSTGCRVSVPEGQHLAAGQMLQVAVDLDTGSSVWADGQVVWVDDEAQIAALRFTRVDPVDQERLDRGVLAALSPRGQGTFGPD